MKKILMAMAAGFLATAIVPTVSNTFVNSTKVKDFPSSLQATNSKTSYSISSSYTETYDLTHYTGTHSWAEFYSHYSNFGYNGQNPNAGQWYGFDTASGTSWRNHNSVISLSSVVSEGSFNINNYNIDNYLYFGGYYHYDVNSGDLLFSVELDFQGVFSAVDVSVSNFALFY